MSATKSLAQPTGIELLARVPREFEEILTPEALAFVANLERAARWTRRELLCARQDRQERLDAGELPDFLPETAARSRTATGGSRRCRPTCKTAAWRSPARSTARW